MRLGRRALLVAGLAAALPARAGVAAPSFRAGIPLPWPVQEIYAALWDGRLVVAGGFRASGPGKAEGLKDLAPTAAVVGLRPGARAWEPLPDLPLALHHPLLVTLGTELWAIGGFSSAPGAVWRMERRVFRLARGAGAWTEGPALPRPQAESIGGVVAGRLMVAAGRTPMEAANAGYADHGDTQDMWVLNADRSGWEAGPRVPEGVNSAGFAVLDGRLHMVGGRYSTGGTILNVATHQVFDGNGWSQAAPLPAPRGGLACATARGELFAFGGESFGREPTVYREVFAFSPRSGQWRQVVLMPEGRHGLGAVGHAGRVHLLGGATAPGGRGTTATTLVFTP